MINILLRLPIASCIARFRCVCRSWRNLLSDPNFIRRILFFQSSDDQKNLKILITKDRYSIYSYETLRLIECHHDDLPTPDGYGWFDLIECCDGIFCINDTRRRYKGVLSHSIILWNPVTSETKILPPSPHHPTRSSRARLYTKNHGGYIGFGFDPETKDYKVVRVLEFIEEFTDDEEDESDHPHETYHGRLPLVFTEVKFRFKIVCLTIHGKEILFLHAHHVHI
ncbi:F-box/kelch-repeat protein At3g23880 [Linum grandiflorum]